MDNLLERKRLGQTDLVVSKLCFGSLALGPYHSRLKPDVAGDLLAESYRLGINFWDTAELYDTYPHISNALKKLYYPDDLVISSRSYARDYYEMMTALRKTLEALEIEHISIFGLHELGGLKDFKESEGAFIALKEAKAEGLIKYIAITMHSVEAANIAAEQDWVDIIFPLYNKYSIGIKHGNADDMQKAIIKASRNGKGVYIMKALAGGHLNTKVEEAIKYVLDTPGVDSVAIGMDNIDEVKMNIALIEDDKIKAEFHKSKLKRYKKIVQVEPWCEGCGECIKACPNNAIKLEFSQAKVDHDKCVLCGYCASACKYFCLKVANIL